MKYVLNYHGCSAACRKKLGEIVGGYQSEIFSTEDLARARLKELQANDSVWEINQVSLKEEIPVEALTFGYDCDAAGGRLYHYEQEDLSETLKCYKSAKRSKQTKTLSPLFVYKKLPI